MTVSASLKQAEKSSNRSCSRVKRCGWAIAMTRPVDDVARGLQHRLDLDRMVAVVVEDLDAVPRSGTREAALDAAEGRQALPDGVGRYAEFMRDRDRRRRVRHVVPAGHRQAQVGDRRLRAGLAVADGHVEQRRRAVHAMVAEAHIGLRVLAIGDDAAVLDAGDQRLHFRMVGAHHAEAVERHVLDELPESLANLVEGAVVVEMLGIDVGDDRDVGRQLQERAVALVGLDHHPLARAHAGIGAVGVDDAAIDHGRVEPAGVEQRRDHRGRRGLAMRAADGDRLAEAHQFGQHLGAPHDRQQLFARRLEFRIGFLDRGRDDDHFGVAEIFGAVADEALDALVAQPLHIGAVGLVGALHAIAEIVQHLGDAAHADAADADEMHQADGLRHLHAALPLPEFRDRLSRRNSLCEVGEQPRRIGFPRRFRRRGHRREPFGIVHRAADQLRQALGRQRRLRHAPRRRRPPQAPPRSPPGRGRAHADRAPAAPAGRSPRSPKPSRRRSAK